MTLPYAPHAIITGAGGGLGRAFAQSLARRGARLVLTDIDAETLKATCEELEGAGAEVVGRPADVANLADLQALAELARDRFGAVDLLINNAGVAVGGPVGEVPIEDWRWQVDVNLWGVIHGCHVFAPVMRARGSGSILNVASAAGLVSMPELGPYNVTKSAVIALSRTLRAELAPAGVNVSVLCPSFFQSGLYRTARLSRAPASALAKSLIVKSRWRAEDVAEAALRGVEKGRLHIVPHGEARLAWWLHRIWPGGFQRWLSRLHGRGRLDAWAARWTGTEPSSGRS